jgi:hypothetical protein
MAKSIRYVGLDVHADTIAVAVCEGRGEGRSLGTIPTARSRSGTGLGERDDVGFRGRREVDFQPPCRLPRASA